LVNIPNLITTLRGLSVPVFIMAIHYSKPDLALLIFLLASISDAVDGFLARRLNQVTRVGVIIDPIADKALIDSGFLMLSFCVSPPGGRPQRAGTGELMRTRGSLRSEVN